MYYCDKCKIASDRDCCVVCGSRNLRVAENGDFCFLIEVKERQGTMLTGILEQESIPCVSVLSGTGVRSAFGLKLENNRLFVPFEFYERAVAILRNLTDELNGKLRASLVNNLDKLHADERVIKKSKKKLKLPAAEDVVEHCKKTISFSEKIIDEGPISGCSEGGNFLFVYNGNEIITVNSATYEIVDARLIKQKY